MDTSPVCTIKQKQDTHTMGQKRPISHKRDLFPAKEAYLPQKRPIIKQNQDTHTMGQKRPISRKRDLSYAKETYHKTKPRHTHMHAHVRVCCNIDMASRKKDHFFLHNLL